MNNSLQTLIQRVVNPNRLYDEIAVVKQTYRKSDCVNLGIEYNPTKHLVCDVELLRDQGYRLYDVKLSPHIYKEGEVIGDGTPESPNGDINVVVPQIGSFVFISYLDENNAYVSVQSNTESIVLGNPNSGYLNFYIKDNKRIIELNNVDEFSIKFPNGQYLTLNKDINNNETSIQLLIDYIELLAENAGILVKDKDISLFVNEGGSIDITNNNYHLGKDILIPLVDSFIGYIDAVNQTYLSFGQPKPLIPLQLKNDLTTIKNKITPLFK